MAGTRSGVPTVIKLARKICRIMGVYGGANLSARTSPEFATAVAALVTACHAFEALDNWPGQIDNQDPRGVEDVPAPPVGPDP